MSSERVSWLEPDGTEHVLTDPPRLILERGWSGWHMPPVEVQREIVPYQPGSLFRYARHATRPLSLPLVINESDRTALWRRLRDVARWFDPGRGRGAVRVLAPDGVTRTLHARCVAGFEGRTDGNAAGVSWQRFVAELEADDPYWHGDPVTLTWTVGGVLVPFFPFFPLVLASSSILTSGTTVDNAGDVETWPVWTVTGPGTDPVLSNQTTGQELALTTTLTEGQTLTIDTRPGAKSVVRNDDANLFGALSATSDLWALAPGPNTVQLVLAAVGANARVDLQFAERFLSP